MTGWAEKWNNWWGNAQPWEKALAIGAIGSIVLALSLGSLLTTRSGHDYAPLYSDLTREDAAAIKEYFDEHRIPYEVSRDHTLLVPPDRVHELRLDLAALGLPSGGVVGFELMEEMPMGATDFDRHIAYIRALQGELARTIEGLDEVQRARVHIVLPEESAFIAQQDPATASIFLEMAQRRELSQEGVRGVMNLVASGVKGLEPERVTVVDTQGSVLSDLAEQQDALTGGAQSNLGLQLEFQSVMKNQIHALLEQVVGPGNAAVQVTADLNFDQRQVEYELFEPIADGDGLVTNLEQIEERYSGTSADFEAGAGADSNVPGYPAAEGAGESEYQRIETHQNTVVNRTTELLTVAPGAVDRLSVAVVINDELTDDESAMFTDVVAAALGTDEGRDDQINVSGMPFDTTLADRIGDDFSDPATEVPVQPIPRSYYLVGGVLLAVLVGLVLGLYARRSAGKAAPAQDDWPDEDFPVPPHPHTEQQRRVLLDAVGTDNGLRRSAIEMAEENPRRIADLARAWMAEEGDSSRE